MIGVSARGVNFLSVAHQGTLIGALINKSTLKEVKGGAYQEGGKR